MLIASYLLISLLFISLGAELLVRSASLLALRIGISPLFIGLTVVGFGTSSPELGASVTATLNGFNDVSVGNVIGSNIFNVAFILGLTAIICPIKVKLAEVKPDIIFAIVAALVPLLALFFNSQIPQFLGFIMVFSLIIYIVKAYRAGLNNNASNQEMLSELSDTLNISQKKQRYIDSTLINIIFIIIAFCMLIGGSNVFVEQAVLLARTFQVSELIIGLTIVSVGTSLPELITSIMAARRGNVDIAVGNIIGSNIFNIFGILGVCAAIKPQLVSMQTFTVDTPLMLLTSVLLLPMIKSGGIISRAEGLFLALIYSAYLSFLIFFA